MFPTTPDTLKHSVKGI